MGAAGCWDLEQLGIPALGSRPQPQCLLRLDLAETLHLGPSAVLQGLRETPTLLLMEWAFRSGLMQFGVFRGQKPES